MKTPWTIVLLIMLLMSATTVHAQGFSATGSMENASGESCVYEQTMERTNSYLMSASTQHLTGQDLRTLTFNDPTCFTGYMNGAVADVITNWYLGIYFQPDANFDTVTLRSPATLQGRGQCVQSRTYQMVSIWMEFERQGDAISRVVHMRGVGGCEFP